MSFVTHLFLYGKACHADDRKPFELISSI